MNLSRVHGAPNGVITDSVVQEIDIKTGLVMWEWHALGHIPLSESHNAGADGQLAVGLRPHQLGRPRRGSGEVLLSPRATPGRLTTSTCTAAAILWRLGGSAQQLQARAGTPLLLAARRRIPAGRADLGVRQRLRPARGEAVARAAARGEPRQPHGRRLVKQFTNPTQDAARLQPGRHCSAWPAATGCWATAGCRTSPSSTPPARCCSTARSARTCRASGPTSLPGAGSRRAPRRSLAPGPRAALSVLGELERRHRSGLLARARAAPRRAALAPGRDGGSSGFQTTIPLPSRGALRAAQALNASGAVIGSSRPRRLRRSPSLSCALRSLRRWSLDDGTAVRAVRSSLRAPATLLSTRDRARGGFGAIEK